MDKPNSTFIQKPWILLIIALVGWFLGTVVGYTAAYIVDGAQNIFDIYADLTILSYLIITTGILGVFLNMTTATANAAAEWTVRHFLLGGVAIVSLWFSHDFREQQSYLDTGFEGFGGRTDALLEYRDPDFRLRGKTTYFLSFVARDYATAGKWYLDSLESMPEEIMTPRELELRDQNREFLNKRR